MRVFTTAVAACVILAAGMLSSSAQAAFQVTLDVDGTMVTITDGGAGDTSGIANLIGIADTVINGYTLSGTIAVTNSPGTSEFAFVVSDLLLQGSGAATVRLFANATGFTAPTAPPAPALIGMATGSFEVTMGSVDFTTSLYLDDTNAVATSGAPADLVASAGVSLVGPISSGSASDQSFVATLSGPYAMNLELIADVTSTGTNLAQMQGTAGIQALPEPTTMAIWGLLGLTAVGGGAWRRRRAAQKS